MGMEAVLELVIPGDPIPKARARVTKNGGSFTPARTRGGEEAVAWRVRQAMGDRVPLEGPMGIAVEFYCATRRRTDGDNLLKLVTDAMNKVAYMDDSQIVEWFARVHRGCADAARTEIFLYSLDVKEL